ncbi:MAG: hypothetical protein SF123_00960 [Chloroflexota bacterium]|nr:hypothetical protein [Chloroflexota bacterium]
MTFKPILHLGQRLSRFAQARIQRYTSLLPGESKQRAARSPEPPDLIWRMPEAGAAYSPDETYDEGGDYQDEVAPADDYEPGAPRPVPADLAAIISGHSAKREAEGTAPPASPFGGSAPPAPRPSSDAGTPTLRRAPDAAAQTIAPSQPRANAPIRRATDTRAHATAPPQQHTADLPKPRRSRESLIAALTGAPREPSSEVPFEPMVQSQTEIDGVPEQPLEWDASDSPDDHVWRTPDEDMDNAPAQAATWDVSAAPLSPPADNAPTPTVAQLMRARAPQRRPSAPPPNSASNEPPRQTTIRTSGTGDASEHEGAQSIAPLQPPPAETLILRKPDAGQSSNTGTSRSEASVWDEEPAVRTPFMASTGDADNMTETASTEQVPSVQKMRVPEDESVEEYSDDSAPMMDLYNALLANGFAVAAVDDVPDAPPANAHTRASDAPIIARKPPPALPSDQLTNTGVEAAFSTRQFKRPTAQQVQREVSDMPAVSAHERLVGGDEGWTEHEGQVETEHGAEYIPPLEASPDAPIPDAAAAAFQTSPTGEDTALPTKPIQRRPELAQGHAHSQSEAAQFTPDTPAETNATPIDSSLFELLGLPPDTPMQGAEIFARRKPAPSPANAGDRHEADLAGAGRGAEYIPPLQTMPDVRTPFMASTVAPQPVENRRSGDIKSMTQAAVQRDAAPANDVATTHASSVPGTPPAPDADVQGAEGGNVNVEQLARDVLSVLRDRLRIESERRSGRG